MKFPFSQAVVSVPKGIGLLFLLIVGLRVCAQTPLKTEASFTPDVETQFFLERRVASAEMALRAGLSATATELFEDLLQRDVWSESELVDLGLSLCSGLIAEGRLSEAEAVLSEIPESARGSRFELYLVIVQAFGNLELSEWGLEQLQRVEFSELKEADLPWFFFLRGLMASSSDDPASAESFFAQAEEAAASEMQRAYFGSLRFRMQIRQVSSSDQIAAELRNRWEKLKGDAAAYPYAREYSVVLANLGRDEEAIDVINVLMESGKPGGSERDQLLLLKGVILGVDSPVGRETLMNLVRIGVDRKIMLVALYMLASDQGGEPEGEFSAFLNELISRPDHLLLSQLYFLRSQLLLQRAERARNLGNAEIAQQQTALAEEDAKRLLDRFPGMRQISDVYRLLAYATLQRTPAQYRVAADYLTQLRDQSEGSEVRSTLNQLIGDCYFLNRDFSNAADFYEAARAGLSENAKSNQLFLRLVTAEVNAGRIESALRHVDEADFMGIVSLEERWQVEWNLARALQGSGEIEKALERVRLLLKDSDAARVSAYLDLRLHWLLLYLRLQIGETGEELLPATRALYRKVSSISDESLTEREVNLLLTEVNLLRAKVFIEAGDIEGGVAVLQDLRQNFPESSAAERSYIVEADYYTKKGSYIRAREQLSELASLYPNGPFAAEALFEAALNAEREGVEAFPDAVRLLNTLAQNYPQSPLLFYARLRQGDLLRSMNDFPGAQILYENLINQFPEHPQRYMAELSRVDCIMALARENPGPLEDATISLDRLLDLPNLPLDFKVEVGYKLVFALSKRGQSKEAKEVGVLLYTEFLKNRERADQLGKAGRYWVARVLLELASIFEDEGNSAEAKEIYNQIIAYNLPGKNLAETRLHLQEN